jgi:hypothetical protein
VDEGADRGIEIRLGGAPALRSGAAEAGAAEVETPAGVTGAAEAGAGGLNAAAAFG